jgi:calcium/calmodulin-dependent protein kinase I
VEKETFTEREARDVMVPMFDALMYCHKMGIVHRDIKLENLLLTTKSLKTGILKVSDFGMARFMSGE